MRIIQRALPVLVAAGALLLSGMVCPAPAADTFPSEDACHVTDNTTPRGDCGSFKQLYAENFSTYGTVPVGKFSGCGGDGDHRCAGLLSGYAHYYSTLGAYPDGWPDTATQWGRGNGGYYRPQDTTSVRAASNGDGQMRVHMWRPSSGGSNHVSAPVPLKCMNLRYGKFTERFVVRTATPGFKMAHLHYSPDEIDYPEAGGNFSTDPVSIFTHGFDEYGKDVAPNSAWTGWHTYSQEITPGHVKAYFDGKLVADRAADYPDVTPWILQNESALDYSSPAPGSSVDIDTTWLTCYSYSP